LAASETGFVTKYQELELRPAARALMNPGRTVVLAVHCHQTGGGQGIDVGFVDLEEATP
jgi:hypothetical protein